MNRTIPQTILSLLPTLNSAELPPQLVDLAGSLLSQSRHLLSSLKADEEIARTYACAHIACDSILPNISTPNPRSGARGKNGALTTPSSVRFRDALAESPSSGRRGARGERPTPSKEQTLAQFRSSGTSGKGSAKISVNDRMGSLANASRTVHLPLWLRPAARFNMTALLAAIVFYSTRAAANNASNAAGNAEVAAAGSLSNEQYKAIEKRLLSAMAKARQEVVVPGAYGGSSGHPGQEANADGNSKNDGWSQWTEIKPRGLKQALMMVNDPRGDDGTIASGKLRFSKRSLP
ncbi:hypothetical protein OOU_Y34scaffold00487g82 [Pyricularia oryzae Y34]|uniref:ORC6 first cyclin-like domain-containing protein n=2 Tax=Pyricularia oryzae TaxID=318829 RepID=A0AA97PM64_PYRO3|nr:hypothetical protein OOU_Y34scaffold00487g82 [Pyricularia oryzae Y34]